MKRFFVFSVLFLIAVGFLALSIYVPGFADVYVKNIHSLWGGTLGWLTGRLKFSVGEILLYLSAGYVGLSALLLLVGLIVLLFGKKKIFVFSLKNLRVVIDIAVVIFLIQVLNCFIIYRKTPLYSEKALGDRIEYTATREDLIELRERLVTRANELAPLFRRDASGNILYEANFAETAKTSLKDLGHEALLRRDAGNEDIIDDQLILLTGYYSDPKPLLKSDFFSQQGIKGYFFPFTMEANYNDIMYIANIPDTMCHELSHFKGFILEDEASFVAYLACMNAGDPLFEYSGILNALSYVNEEIMKEIEADPSLYDRITKKNDYVIHDCVFLTDEEWNKVEEDALLDTEMVNAASEEFLDTNLTLNGVDDGIRSYSRMVDLLLKYEYYGSLGVNTEDETEENSGENDG